MLQPLTNQSPRFKPLEFIPHIDKWPQLARLLETLKPLTAPDAVDRLCDFFSKKFTYSKSTATRTAYAADDAHVVNTALKMHAGICAESAAAFVAVVTHALQLPARVRGGNMWSKAAGFTDGHAWAEVYLQGRWQLFDPTGAVADVETRARRESVQARQVAPRLSTAVMHDEATPLPGVSGDKTVVRTRATCKRLGVVRYVEYAAAAAPLAKFLREKYADTLFIASTAPVARFTDDCSGSPNWLRLAHKHPMPFVTRGAGRKLSPRTILIPCDFITSAFSHEVMCEVFRVFLELGIAIDVVGVNREITRVSSVGELLHLSSFTTLTVDQEATVAQVVRDQGETDRNVLHGDALRVLVDEACFFIRNKAGVREKFPADHLKVNRQVEWDTWTVARGTMQSMAALTLRHPVKVHPFDLLTVLRRCPRLQKLTIGADVLEETSVRIPYLPFLTELTIEADEINELRLDYVAEKLTLKCCKPNRCLATLDRPDLVNLVGSASSGPLATEPYRADALPAPEINMWLGSDPGINIGPRGARGRR